MATVDTLSIDITTSSKNANRSLTALLKTLKQFNEIDNTTLNSISRSFRSLNSSISTISAVNIRKIERLADALERLKAAKTINTKVTNTVTEASDIVEQAKPKVPTTPTGTSTSTPGSNGASTSSELSNIGNEAEKTEEKLTGLQKVMGAVSTFGKGLGTVFNILGKAIGKILKPITHFIKSLARVAFYRFIRGIIKSITQGFQEGIQNLALYSKALNGLDVHNANEVMSRYASTFLYFKNAIATAVIPVLRALIPLVEQAMQKIIDFINVIAQFGSAFFGTNYTKAQYFWVDYADSIDNATGSAKALNHQLAGFDELNNLTANNGGGGGTSKMDNAKDMFDTAAISGKILEIVEKIKKAWDWVNQALQPIKDKLKMVFDWWSRLWERISPNLTRIWEVVKKLWEEAGKPFVEGFIKGFAEGLFGDENDTIIDFLEKLTDKLADGAEWFEKLVSKIDTDKIKKFGEIVGKILGNLAFYAAYLPIPVAIFGQPKFWSDLDKLHTKITTLNEDTAQFLTAVTISLLDLINICSDLGLAIGTAIGEFLRTKDIETAWKHLTENLKQVFETAKDIIGGDLDIIKEKLLKVIEDIPIIGAIAKAFSDEGIKGSASSNAQLLGKGHITTNAQLKGYANGGFPDGDLFIANENAPEMVGSVNGRTAVANNQMITEAIATATYNAMSRALSENNGSVSVVVEGDGDQMFKVWQKKQREYQRATGLAY